MSAVRAHPVPCESFVMEEVKFAECIVSAEGFATTSSDVASVQ